MSKPDGEVIQNKAALKVADAAGRAYICEKCLTLTEYCRQDLFETHHAIVQEQSPPPRGDIHTIVA